MLNREPHFDDSILFLVIVVCDWGKTEWFLIIVVCDWAIPFGNLSMWFAIRVKQNCFLSMWFVIGAIPFGSSFAWLVIGVFVLNILNVPLAKYRILQYLHRTR